MEILTFVKNNITLCLATLGLALVGYLGYRAVLWILAKVGVIKKIDDVAQKIIHTLSIINPINTVKISPNKVTIGHGEYVVFHQDSKQIISKEKFETAFAILLHYSPAAIVKRAAYDECANRYELMKAKIKELDPNLEVAFVPKSLYELFFIKKCIKEDLKHKSICPYLCPIEQTITPKFFANEGGDEVFANFLATKKEVQLKRKCWHLGYYVHEQNVPDTATKELAFRLNQVIVKALLPSKEGFTHQELASCTEKEFSFFKDYYNTCTKDIARNGNESKLISSCTTPGPTTNFGYESNRGSIKAMCIRNDADAQIIRNALALECSEIAQRSFLLYRGSDFQTDSNLCRSNKDKPYSISYGTSLFAGCVYDGGATAYYYMRQAMKDAYVLSIPYDRLQTSPFYIPQAHTITQLLSDGESFHARTTSWKDFDITQLRGIQGGANYKQVDHLQSQLTQEEHTLQFQAYKNLAIQLKV